MNWFYILTTFIAVYSVIPAATPTQVTYLQQGEKYNFDRSTHPEFRIFCYKGRPKYLIHVWQSVFLQLIHSSEDYSQYDGATPELVTDEFTDNRYSWSLNLFPSKQRQLKLNPFNQSCIGIESKNSYTVFLNVIRVDYWKVLLLLLGISLFISADKLSKNTLFYYICGVTLGICTSFLILIYFVSKLFPRKPMMYGVAACGWTVGIYLLQLLWENVRVILKQYQIYLLWYTVITGFISFVVCYRWGPVENERSRNLIRWALQLSGLILMYFSTQFQEAAMAQIAFLVIFYNIPPTWLSQPQKYWKKRFPPKVQLLNNDQYYEQGVRETTKALKELQEYCSSPDCKQWNLALKLKDVKRFASFVEGNSHLSDDEILEYETSIHTTDLTDDESSAEEEY